MNESTSGMREFGQYLEGIFEQQKPSIIEHAGRPYLKTTDGISPILEPVAKKIDATTLTSLVDYIKSDIDAFKGVLIHVVSPDEVVLLSRMFGANRQRETYMTVKALTPNIALNTFIDQERFIIQSQSCFAQDNGDDLSSVLSVAGNIRESAVKDTLDDGVSQVVTARSGVAKLSDVVVPKQVLLTPIRTFAEIQQPESSFVFRIQDGPRMALFEADGGAWKNEGMIRIKEYLEEALSGSAITFSIIA